MDETLSGTGHLLIGDTEHLCQYHLDIYQDRGLRSGDGFVVSTERTLWEAFNAASCKLRLKDGRTCPIIITRYSAGNGDAAFKMAGGFSDT